MLTQIIGVGLMLSMLAVSVSAVEPASEAADQQKLSDLLGLAELGFQLQVVEFEGVTLSFVYPRAPDSAGLPVEVLPGAGAGPHPVAIFSHGLSATGRGYRLLAATLAERGYTVLAPFHAETVRPLTPGGGQDTLTMVIEATAAETRQQRRAELQRVIDAVVQQEPVFEKYQLNSEQIVVIGHSLGASTVLSLRGQNADDMQRIVDRRIRAAVALSIPTPGFIGLSDDSWNNLVGPVLFVTGTQDTTIGTADWRDRLLPFTRAPAGGVASLVIADLRHHELGDYDFLGKDIRRDPHKRAVAMTVIVRWLDVQLGREAGDDWIRHGFTFDGAALSVR